MSFGFEMRNKKILVPNSFNILKPLQSIKIKLIES